MHPKFSPVSQSSLRQRSLIVSSSFSIRRHNKSVTYIDFSENNLTEEVSAALIALAQNTRSVTAIRLDGNEVRREIRFWREKGVVL